MNHTIVLGSVCAAVLFYYAAAQSFEDPKRYYKPMKFDVKISGSFNMTPCLREMLNCYESVRPDMLCVRQTRMVSLCELRAQVCVDYYGYEKDGHNFHRKFHAFNQYCPAYVYNQYWNQFGSPNSPYWRRRALRPAPPPPPGSGLPGAPDDTVMFWL